MTMDDYEDVAAFWVAHPPLDALAAAYFKIQPRPVRVGAAASAPAQSMVAAFPNGIIG